VIFIQNLCAGYRAIVVDISVNNSGIAEMVFYYVFVAEVSCAKPFKSALRVVDGF
jgi:hypothetical protein